MAEYEGNVLRPPGMGAIVTVVSPEEVLYSFANQVKKGGTAQAGAGVFKVGEPVKYDGSGYIVKASASPTDAVGVNVTAVDCTTEAHELNVLFGGVVNAKVSGIVGKETVLATALGGIYNSTLGYIKF